MFPLWVGFFLHRLAGSHSFSFLISRFHRQIRFAFIFSCRDPLRLLYQFYHSILLDNIILLLHFSPRLSHLHDTNATEEQRPLATHPRYLGGCKTKCPPPACLRPDFRTLGMSRCLLTRRVMTSRLGAACFSHGNPTAAIGQINVARRLQASSCCCLPSWPWVGRL
jgi:hypothetical protein